MKGQIQMKDIIRDKKIEIRLTAEEKEQIKAYANRLGVSMSEAVRVLCYRIFQEEK